MNIILFIILCLIIISLIIKFSGKVFLESNSIIIDKIIKNRLLRIILLLIISVLVPAITISMSIIITDSREMGLMYGFRLPFLIINFIYGFIIIKSKLIIKLIIGLSATIFSSAIIWYIYYSDFIQIDYLNKIDPMGIIGFILLSVLFWEAIINYRNNHNISY